MDTLIQNNTVNEWKSCAIRTRTYIGQPATLEVGTNISNTISTVTKDFMVMDEKRIRIRKLTAKECLRLMAVSDDRADKMLEVNSNSQCYKQAGNSITVNVLEMIFGQMFEGKEDFWKRWLNGKCYEVPGHKE